MKLPIIALLMVSVILVSGCTQQQDIIDRDKVRAETACILFCKQALDKGSLEEGPCISDDFLEDWVCDVAHSPRQAVDEKPENQCPSFGKTANRFVEVDPNCNLIRSL